MKKLIIVILTGALLFSSCSSFSKTELMVSNYDAINVNAEDLEDLENSGDFEFNAQSSSLLLDNTKQEATNLPDWLGISWVVFTEEKVDPQKLSKIEQNKLRERMEYDISQFFVSKSVISTIQFEQNKTIIDIFVGDSNISLLFFYEVEKLVNYIEDTLYQQALIHINFGDITKINELLSRYSELSDIKEKITTSTKFTISSLSLPEDTSMSNSMFKEYIRKRSIYDELGEDAKIDSDAEVLTSLYTILDPMGVEYHVVAPILGDGLYFAVKYQDFGDSSRFILINQARDFYSSIIGKQSQVTIFYYSDIGWERLKWDLQGKKRIDLTVFDLECVAAAEYLKTDEDFLKSSLIQYEYVQNWVLVTDERDAALIAHYKGGGSKYSFNYSAYPILSPVVTGIAEVIEENKVKNEIGFDIIAYSEELSEGKMSGYPVTGGRFIPKEWFSRWHDLDYIKTDREGRIDLMLIKEENRNRDWDLFCSVLEEDFLNTFVNKDLFVQVLIFNGNIRVDVLLRDDKMQARRTFESLERIYTYMEYVFTEETKINIIVNVCDPYEWDNILEEYDYVVEGISKSASKLMTEDEFNFYKKQMLITWFDTYGVIFKMQIEDYKHLPDVVSSMTKAYLLAHSNFESKK